MPDNENATLVPDLLGPDTLAGGVQLSLNTPSDYQKSRLQEYEYSLNRSFLPDPVFAYNRDLLNGPAVTGNAGDQKVIGPYGPYGPGDGPFVNQGNGATPPFVNPPAKKGNGKWYQIGQLAIQAGQTYLEYELAKLQTPQAQTPTGRIVYAGNPPSDRIPPGNTDAGNRNGVGINTPPTNSGIPLWVWLIMGVLAVMAVKGS